MENIESSQKFAILPLMVLAILIMTISSSGKVQAQGIPSCPNGVKAKVAAGKEQPLDEISDIVSDLSETISSGFKSFWSSVTKRPEPVGPKIPNNLEDFFTEMNEVNMVEIRTAKKDGGLDHEMAKDLDRSKGKLPGWPEINGEPMPMYRTVLADIKRNDYEIKTKGQLLYKNKNDRGKLSEEELALVMFNHLKTAVLNGIMDLNDHRSKNGKEPHTFNDDLINNMVHRAMASRTQTFDADNWALINKQRKKEYEPPLVKIEDRLTTYDVKGNRIKATTLTSFKISFNTTDLDSPHLGKSLGTVYVERVMDFDTLSGAFSDEKVTLKKTKPNK